MKIKEKVLGKIDKTLFELQSVDLKINSGAIIDLTLAEVEKIIEKWGINIKKTALRTIVDREMFDEDVNQLFSKIRGDQNPETQRPSEVVAKRGALEGDGE